MSQSSRPMTCVESKSVRRKMLIAKSLGNNLTARGRSKISTRDEKQSLVGNIHKNNFMDSNVFYQTASPDRILFDESGNGIQRSYIGPQNFLNRMEIER